MSQCLCPDELRFPKLPKKGFHLMSASKEDCLVSEVSGRDPGVPPLLCSRFPLMLPIVEPFAFYFLFVHLLL